MQDSIAVVGAGYWGQNLVRNFHELGALRAICDSREEVASRYARELPDVEFFRSFEDLLRSEAIRAVALAVPAPDHFRMARMALEAGRDVFVEKPLALIWHFCHIMRGARIGARCILGQNVFVGADVSIGDGVKVQNNVSVYKGVTLEDHVFCGPSVVFTNVVNPRSEIERKEEFRPTLVRRGATLGANSTILCGHTIGRYAMVGAGAVVTRDVPDFALVVGAPARQVGWVCRCGVRLPSGSGPLRCSACGAVYSIAREGGLSEEGDSFA
jgi:UDP-2-acetamido-3-amino-2,3-dideoxy-glucuronate N-acetyltransferase